MNVKILGIIIIFLNNFRICQSRRYDNFSLYNVVPTEVEHMQFLQNLDKQKYIDVVFWKKPYKMFEDVQFIVNPADKELFIERSIHYKMKMELMSTDIQSAFDNQRVQRYFKMRDDTFSWNAYHDLEDIYQWLTDIALKYPEIVQLDSIGQTAEGREILSVSINKKGNKPKVIVECGIHGNEWVAVELATYLINTLVHVNDIGNKKLAEVYNKYDWYIIPLLNPDGFVYSHKEDRLWRKNRRNIDGIIGVDLNRNFDHSFGNFDTSSDPKDDYYCGPSPFSEPETRILAQFLMHKKEKLKFYFSFHAYGQKIIIPFADRIKHVENYGEMENYGKQALMKMYKVHHTIYSVGTTYDTLGVRISGNSASWVKKTLNVQYVFTFLLRDNGTFGYALPPEQIQPTCEESLMGILELMTAKPRRVRLVFNLASSLESKKYYSYKLYRGIPVNETHLEFFKSLIDQVHVNFWRPPGLLNMPVELAVGPKRQPSFLRDAEKQGVYLTTIIEDVQKAFDIQIVKTYIRRKMDSFDWNSYFRLEDIYEWLTDLSNAYPKIMNLRSLGKTYENRDIMAVTISLEGDLPRSKVFIEGGIHAREWISPAFVTFLIYQILHADQSNNKALKEIAFNYDWYIVPVVNPDGYEYSHTKDRLWRKNRHGGSRGVDLNRNFDVSFGGVGVSRNKRSEIYCGEKAFSEKETVALARFIKYKSEDIEYYLSFHSYGQYMIIPYAHSKGHQDNYDEVKNMCNQAARRIAARYKTQYTSGTAYDTVGYLTSGVSGCWVKKTFKVPYVVTFELRDSGYYGFALPPSKIMPTCMETMDGLISMLAPRKDDFRKLKIYNTTALSGSKCNVLDEIIFFWEILLFITVRFD